VAVRYEKYLRIQYTMEEPCQYIENHQYGHLSAPLQQRKRTPTSGCTRSMRYTWNSTVPCAHFLQLPTQCITWDTWEGKTYGASMVGSLFSCFTKKKPNWSRILVGVSLPWCMGIHEALIRVTFNAPNDTIKMSFNIPTYCRVASDNPGSPSPPWIVSVKMVHMAES